MNAYETLAALLHSMMHDPGYIPEQVAADALLAADIVYGPEPSEDKSAFIEACGVHLG